MNRRNEKGYVTTTLVILMPLFISVLALIAAGYLLLRGDVIARHACRTELLQSQARIAKDAEALMALNSTARSLRRQLQVAKKAAEAAPSPITLGYLGFVQLRQVILAARQKVILVRGKARSRLEPYEALVKVRGAIAKTQNVQAGLPSIDLRGSVRTAAFDMVASPSDSLTPDYQPSFGFLQSQEMKVSWSFDATSMLPSWIRTFVGAKGLVLNGECSATIEQKGSKWESKLTKAKL